MQSLNAFALLPHRATLSEVPPPHARYGRVFDLLNLYSIAYFLLVVMLHAADQAIPDHYMVRSGNLSVLSQAYWLALSQGIVQALLSVFRFVYYPYHSIKYHRKDKYEVNHWTTTTKVTDYSGTVLHLLLGVVHIVMVANMFTLAFTLKWSEWVTYYDRWAWPKIRAFLITAIVFMVLSTVFYLLRLYRSIIKSIYARPRIINAQSPSSYQQYGALNSSTSGEGSINSSGLGRSLPSAPPQQQVYHSPPQQQQQQQQHQQRPYIPPQPVDPYQTQQPYANNQYGRQRDFGQKGNEGLPSYHDVV